MRSKFEDVIIKNGCRIRFETRCPSCGTIVRGKKTHFHLSTMKGYIEFRCPICGNDRQVEFDKIKTIEIPINIPDKLL